MRPHGCGADPALMTTVLAVAHRPPTVTMADHIIVTDTGLVKARPPMPSPWPATERGVADPQSLATTHTALLELAPGSPP